MTAAMATPAPGKLPDGPLHMVRLTIAELERINIKVIFCPDHPTLHVRSQMARLVCSYRGHPLDHPLMLELFPDAFPPDVAGKIRTCEF